VARGDVELLELTRAMIERTRPLKDNQHRHIRKAESYERALSTTTRMVDLVLALRMCRFGDGLHGLPRMVRDLARSLGMDVRLDVHGTATLADRAMLARMDPHQHGAARGEHALPRLQRRQRRPLGARHRDDDVVQAGAGALEQGRHQAGRAVPVRRRAPPFRPAGWRHPARPAGTSRVRPARARANPRPPLTSNLGRPSGARAATGSRRTRPRRASLCHHR
jgi:hypothetical protein